VVIAIAALAVFLTFLATQNEYYCTAYEGAGGDQVVFRVNRYTGEVEIWHPLWRDEWRRYKLAEY